jgi:hypothetical protein
MPSTGALSLHQVRRPPPLTCAPLPSGRCPRLLRRFEGSQPLGELAVRGAGPRDDRGCGQRFEKMTGQSDLVTNLLADVVETNHMHPRLNKTCSRSYSMWRAGGRAIQGWPLRRKRRSKWEALAPGSAGNCGGESMRQLSQAPNPSRGARPMRDFTQSIKLIVYEETRTRLMSERVSIG